MRRRVLLLSRNYPNAALPELGLWVEGLVRHAIPRCDPRVIAPVPYWPPVPGPADYVRFRRVPRVTWLHGVPVWHPRFVTGPGYSMHALEAGSMYWSVRRWAARIHAAAPVDLVHAYFAYPDGVVAARLGADLRCPVLITEQASWRPWMDDYPRVRRQAMRAVATARYVIAPSRAARADIAHFVGESAHLRVIPNGVDAQLFAPLPPGRAPDPDRIVYVGFLKHVKGVDVLLRAMAILGGTRRQARLVLVGGSFYRAARAEAAGFRALARSLGLDGRVEFAGVKSPAEVAAHMRESAVLVLPSRRETFGSVLVEALASGTPVVATRCGGPEDIVTGAVGHLVDREDPAALAGAIEDVLAHRDRYDPASLRAYALERFAWDRVVARTVALYDEAIAAGPPR